MVEIINTVGVFGNHLPRDPLIIVVGQAHDLEFVLVLDLAMVSGGYVRRHLELA